MARSCYCPKCGEDISDAYQPQEDDVGIVGGWFCEKCDIGVSRDGDDYELDYED